MKIPLRKLKTLGQYCLLGGLIIAVVFVVSNFKENDLGKPKNVPVPEEQVWEGLKNQEHPDPGTSEDIPRLPNKNVGIEDIQKDSLPDSSSLVDWHNWTLIQMEKERVGPGEQGKPLVIPKEEEEQNQHLFRSNGFSGYASDLISIDRSVPDIRHPGCRTKLYHANLPTVSVVIPFYNEHWSTLLRTFHSVINRSPRRLLKEVILVDDASNKPELKIQLEEYIAKIPKVSLVRLDIRGGLITARLEGAKKATAEVIIFLDSHTEANVNWLPPLLDPISQDYRTAVCPFIDVVDFNNFEYRAQDEGARGAFDWQLYYKRLPLLPEDLKHPTEPFKSPVMAGGLFAISSKFFWELGGYDPGLEIWGGEQYELSFKIWQCGGSMVDAPCSRVGHIYRKYSPFGGSGRGDYLGRNYKRVAAVWMDEYAEYVYKHRPHYRDMDAGDLTQQIELRKKLQCKSFKWFMTEVAFDLPKHYPPIEPEDFVSGEIKSTADSSLCVDSDYNRVGEEIGMQKCMKGKGGKSGGEQQFSLSWRKDMRIKNRRKICWDVNSYESRAPITLYDCHGQGGNQFWKYDTEHRWLVHGGNPRCLDHDPGTKKLFVTKCDVNSVTQQWAVEHVNLAQLEKWEDPTKDLF